MNFQKDSQKSSEKTSGRISERASATDRNEFFSLSGTPIGIHRETLRKIPSGTSEAIPGKTRISREK